MTFNGVIIDQDDEIKPIDVISILKRLEEESLEELLIFYELNKFELIKLLNPE